MMQLWMFATPVMYPLHTVPANWHVRRDPFVHSGLMTGIGGIPGDGGWTKRNATDRRLGGTHQHSLFAMFDPARYERTQPSLTVDFGAEPAPPVPGCAAGPG